MFWGVFSFVKQWSFRRCMGVNQPLVMSTCCRGHSTSLSAFIHVETSEFFNRTLRQYTMAVGKRTSSRRIIHCFGPSCMLSWFKSKCEVLGWMAREVYKKWTAVQQNRCPLCSHLEKCSHKSHWNACINVYHNNFLKSSTRTVVVLIPEFKFGSSISVMKGFRIFFLLRFCLKHLPCFNLKKLFQ